MEEIKVGEYVRTKYGEIGIVTNIFPRLKWKKRKASSNLELNVIKSHSKNLIDLIEVGDIVNGSKVVDKAQGEILAVYTEQATTGALIPITKDKIKTILTKEQYQANCYVVEREE